MYTRKHIKGKYFCMFLFEIIKVANLRSVQYNSRRIAADEHEESW